MITTIISDPSAPLSWVEVITSKQRRGRFTRPAVCRLFPCRWRAVSADADMPAA